MIRIPLLRLLLGATFCVLLANPCGARAGIAGSTETKLLDEWANMGGLLFPGGPIGIEPVEPKANTAVSIIFPWYNGRVDLTAVLRGGRKRGNIDVAVTGYEPGSYTVSAVTESSSSTVVLGSLTVVGSSNTIIPIPLRSAELRAEAVLKASPEIVVREPWGMSAGEADFGGRRNPFPDGFDPFDVATVSLTNTNGSVVSTATLTPVENGFYSAVSPLAPGAGAPGATGFASIRAQMTTPIVMPMMAAASAASSVITTGSVWSGPVPIVPPVHPLPPIFYPASGQVVIHARGLPASETVSYAADGTVLGTAETSASGKLFIGATEGNGGNLPSTLDLFSVKSVTVTDGSGNVLVSAGF